MLQSVILTGFGGLLAITGAIAGYLLQNREARRARLESYKREDTFRLHQDRRQAYQDFHLTFVRAQPSLYATIESPGDVELRAKVREARQEVHQSYLPLWHIAGPQVVQAARGILDVYDAVGWRDAPYSWDNWIDRVDCYVLAVRNDLLKQESSLQEAVTSGALSPKDSDSLRLPEFDPD
jgi:hypothetical protein